MTDERKIELEERQRVLEDSINTLKIDIAALTKQRDEEIVKRLLIIRKLSLAAKQG